MSRHRSPGGRLAHPRQLPPSAVGAAPARSALRHGLTAAAVTGGALALAAPGLALVEPPGAEVGGVADEAVVRLAAADPAAAAPAGAAVRMAVSIAPVAATEVVAVPAVDAADLLKAVGLEEVARKAEEERLAREARANCDADTSDAGAVKPWVRDTARFLSCLYERPDLIGVAARNRVSDHPTGHALDLMVRGERGDRIAECALANQDALGVDYVIWEQRVNYGGSWQPMADRGGDTANHFDHVHLSFEKGTPPGDPTVEVCD